MTDSDKPRLRFGPLVFDWTVTIPDVIAIIGSASAIIMAYASLDRRIEVHEVKLQQHDKELAAASRADENARSEFRSDLKEIKDRLDRLIERQGGRQ
jgi:hypothetical protein